MLKLINALAGWRGYAMAAAVALAVGFSGGWTVRDWKAARDDAAAIEAAHQAQLAAVAKALRIERAQADTSDRIAAEAAEAQTQIRTVTRTLIKEVPVYVTPDDDRRCVVPVGFVRIHDAAAAGIRPLPDPAGRPDDAPSGLALSAVAGTVVENYAGTCAANARQLSDLQAWVRAQAAVMNGPPPSP
tara:strand:- start:8540 stop:9100 length:561 start_codon:yes stop_codon:yes gene_type:complete